MTTEFEDRVMVMGIILCILDSFTFFIVSVIVMYLYITCVTKKIRTN